MAHIREIRRYPNRRLYDLTRRSYITMADVHKLIVKGLRVRVRDQRNADVTNDVLLQVLAKYYRKAKTGRAFLEKAIRDRT